MSRVVWTPQAEQDLENIAYHIAVAGSGIQTAKHNIGQIRDKCSTYGRNPLLGSALAEAEGYRFFTFKRWVVVYWVRENGIVVEAVIDASRDFVRVFRDRAKNTSD